MTKKTEIFVYADWIGLKEPVVIGILTAQQTKGRKAFSFAYDKAWLQSDAQRWLDPDIQWFTGPQHPVGKENFGAFMDSMPDTWGRKLMLRRAAQRAAEAGEPVPTLYDIDFLLGVYDKTRMGALRFKLDPEGPFLDNNTQYPTPPWSTVRELQHAAEVVESDKESREIAKYTAILMAPGSSLGGARPKANILDEEGNFWIAKFPAKADTTDKAAWEFVACQLARKAGIGMSPCRLEHISGEYRTFFSKRFDREGRQRIHFASAMTMTGKNENMLRDAPASYLDIALFIQNSGSQVTEDLHQLWRRMVFNILISNTDDHLINHGFLLGKKGWRLSPAFDLNPTTDKAGLELNIDADNNELDLALARSVGDYFRLRQSEMNQIISEVEAAVSNWKAVAGQTGLSRQEIESMAPAFSNNHRKKL